MSGLEWILAFYVVLFGLSTAVFWRMANIAFRGWRETLEAWKRSNDEIAESLR